MCRSLVSILAFFIPANLKLTRRIYAFDRYSSFTALRSGTEAKSRARYSRWSRRNAHLKLKRRSGHERDPSLVPSCPSSLPPLLPSAYHRLSLFTHRSFFSRPTPHIPSCIAPFASPTSHVGYRYRFHYGPKIIAFALVRITYISCSLLLSIVYRDKNYLCFSLRTSIPRSQTLASWDGWHLWPPLGRTS